MKTYPLKKIVKISVIAFTLIYAVICFNDLTKEVKHLYEIEKSGNGSLSFFEIIQ